MNVDRLNKKLLVYFLKTYTKVLYRVRRVVKDLKYKVCKLRCKYLGHEWETYSHIININGTKFPKFFVLRETKCRYCDKLIKREVLKAMSAMELYCFSKDHDSPTFREIKDGELCHL